jgi:hypothetical protein
MRLAICVTIKNRSCVLVDPENSLQFLHHVNEKIEDCEALKIQPWMTKEGQIALPLFPKMVRSLMAQKKPDDDWVLVVVDYKSTDVNLKEMLEYEVGTKMPWHLEVIEDYAFFDRGGGLAKAASLAETKFQADALFFCDADLLFASRDIFDQAYQSLQKGQYFYPIFFAFAHADHSQGFWRDTSFGNFACLLKDYKATEGWYHNVSWGWEDRALADSIPSYKKDREHVPGFFHQWHPMKWEFRVTEYPVKGYVFRDAAVKVLPKQQT